MYGGWGAWLRLIDRTVHLIMNQNHITFNSEVPPPGTEPPAFPSSASHCSRPTQPRGPFQPEFSKPAFQHFPLLASRTVSTVMLSYLTSCLSLSPPLLLSPAPSCPSAFSLLTQLDLGNPRLLSVTPIVSPEQTSPDEPSLPSCPSTTLVHSLPLPSSLPL